MLTAVIWQCKNNKKEFVVGLLRQWTLNNHYCLSCVTKSFYQGSCRNCAQITFQSSWPVLSATYVSFLRAAYRHFETLGGTCQIKDSSSVKALPKEQRTWGVLWHSKHLSSKLKIQQTLKSGSNFSLVLFGNGQEIQSTTLTNPSNNYAKSMWQLTGWFF